MKKTVFLMAMLCVPILLGAQNYVVFIGDVIADGIPVGNHPVQVQSQLDSNIWLTTYTDPNGMYYDSVLVERSQDLIEMYTVSPCDSTQILRKSHVYSSGQKIYRADFSCITPCNSAFSIMADSNINVNDSVKVEIHEDDPTYTYTIAFGDGHRESGRVAYHSYQKPGWYTICAIVSGPACSDSTCQNIYIQPEDSSALECDASFSIMADNTIVVKDKVSVNIHENDPDYDYLIDFGDGTTRARRMASHRYKQSGWYQICATVSGSGCSDTQCNTIYVEPKACDASFTLMPDSVMGVNDSVRVRIHENDPDYDYLIDFGDGTTSVGRIASHRYQQSGWFTICATVSGAGCTDTRCNTIYVEPDACDASFSIMPDSGIAANEWVRVEIHESDPGYDYRIDFGDGNRSAYRIASHSYRQAGWYTICATVLGSGCSDTQCDSIFVEPDSSLIGYTISGTVYQSDSRYLDNGRVLLYNNRQLVDSAMIVPGDSGQYYFEAPGAGTYYTYAQPVGSVNEENLASTYHRRSLFWETADKIVLSEESRIGAMKDIYLYRFQGASGVGEILGRIFWRKSKEVAGAQVLLFKDDLNTPVASAITNTHGEYAFENLPFGDYIVGVELFKYKDTNLYVTLDGENPESVNNNHFVGDGEIILSVASLSGSNYAVFPNPFTQYIRAEGLQQPAGFVLRDHSGRVLLHGILEPQGRIDTRLLGAGVYVLTIDNDAYKVVKR